MNDFIVDNEKRKEIIKLKRKELRGGAKFLYIGSKVVCLIAALVLVMSFLQIVIIDDYMEMIAFAGVFAVLSVLIWAVSYIMNAILEKKYMYLWTIGMQEELHLQNNSLEYGRYSKHRDKLFRTWKIQYSQIEKMEYDFTNYGLRIYASMTYKEWIDKNRTMCLNSGEIKNEGNNATYITIPTYFKDFDLFTKELEEKTGKLVVKTHIAL